MEREEQANSEDSGVSSAGTYAAGPGAAAAVSDGEFELRSTPRCQHCDSDGGAMIGLDCNMHYYCRECFRRKTRQDGTTDMYVCRAKECEMLEQLRRWPVDDEARHLLLTIKDGQIETKELVLELNEENSPLLTFHVANFLRREAKEPLLNVTVLNSVYKQTRNTTAATREAISNMPCCSGKNCEDGANCKYFHSSEDMDFFGNGKGNRYLKTQLCKKFPKCDRSTIKCKFAHGESDGWCINKDT